MKIIPVKPDLHKNINFKSAAGGTINSQYPHRNNEPEENPHPSHGCLRTLGNGLYWGLVLNAIVVTPIMKHNLDKSWREKMEYEHAINQDFYNLSDKLYKKDGVSSAYFNINKLHDVDGATIIKSSQNDYLAAFELDNKVINMHMNINEQNKDSISGVMTIKGKQDNDSVMWINDYYIKFTDKDAPNFTLKLKSREDNSEEKNITLSRNGDELYLIENGKKVLINKKNVNEYRENQSLEEEKLELYKSANERNRVTLIFLTILTLLKWRAANIRQQREQQQ